MFKTASNTVRLGLGFVALFLITACSGGNSQEISSGSNLRPPSTERIDVQEEVGEIPIKSIRVKILGPCSTRPDHSLVYRFEAGETVVDQEWEIDGETVSYERELNTSFEKVGDHNVSLKITGLESNGKTSKKVVVKDTDTVNWVSIEITGIDPEEIKSAQYYSVDKMGEVLDFRVFGEGDFRQEEGVLSLPLKIFGAEFYSHLTIYFKDGRSTALKLQDGEFRKLPLTMILKKKEETIDDMSGLHSLYFEIETSDKVNLDRVLSCKALIDGEFVDSNYDRFSDRTVYEWSDKSFKMKSFALGYGDSNVSQTSLCLEMHAEDQKSLMCSDMH